MVSCSRVVRHDRYIGLVDASECLVSPSTIVIGKNCNISGSKIIISQGSGVAVYYTEAMRQVIERRFPQWIGSAEKCSCPPVGKWRTASIPLYKLVFRSISTEKIEIILGRNVEE